LPPAEAAAWETVGIHCSANERRADEASRDVEAWLKCMFMRERLGEEYGGTVSAVTSFGLFVQLDELYVEGLIHITELGGEYYRFDETRQELRGERTGTRYVVGSRVRVQVSRVDLDTRKIDFRPVREVGEERSSPASGRKRNRGSDKDWVEPGAAQEALAEVRQADLEVKRASKAARGAGKGRTRVSVAATVSGKTGSTKGSRGKR
jgi:ribonuclease R